MTNDSTHKESVATPKYYLSDTFDAVWPQAQPLIAKALDRGSIYTIEEIEKGLYENKFQLWTWETDHVKAAMVTAIQSKDGVTFCLLLALGGTSINEWIRYLPEVEQWAEDNGCDEMRIYGRIGWAKYTGYDIEYTKMVRKL